MWRKRRRLTCLTMTALTWDSRRVESLRLPTRNCRNSEPFLWQITAFLENITVFFLKVRERGGL